jgi:drug/metabolite transporter (DMT)-like permease
VATRSDAWAEPAPPSARARRLPLPAAAPLAALVTVSLWASAFVGIRSAGASLSPGALALGRLLVGAAVLGLLLVARQESLPRRVDLRGGVVPSLLVCGLLWFGA